MIQVGGLVSVTTKMNEPPCSIRNADAATSYELAVLSSNSESAHETTIAPIDVESDPRQWPTSRKRLVSSALSLTGLNRIMIATMMAPAIPAIQLDLHMSETQLTIALSIYVLTTCVAPVIVGPLSEIYGRSRLVHISNASLLAFNLLCGISPNGATLISARFWAGVAAGAIFPLSNGVLGDLYSPEERGRSLRTYQLIPLLGSGIGPLLAGFIVLRTNWRWIFWTTSILQVVMSAFALCFLRETHVPTIVRRRDRRSAESSGQFNTRRKILTRLQESVNRLTSRDNRHKLSLAMRRPMRLLQSHHGIQLQALLQMLEYGTLYLMLSSLAPLFASQYGETTAISGLHYLAPCIGEIAGAQIGGAAMDHAAKRRIKSQDQLHHPANASGPPLPSTPAPFEPERHLFFLWPSQVCVCAGLLVYGWCAHAQAGWIFVDLGVVLTGFGLQMVTQTLTAYNIDANIKHSGSASGAVQFPRSLGAFGFTIFAPSMFSTLGYGLGNTLIAGVTLIVGISLPWWLTAKGSTWRARMEGKID